MKEGSAREALIIGTMMMAEALVDDDIFVYMGGNQRVPDGVRRARIHKSVKIVPARAFSNRRNLISVEFHDGVEIIEDDAFYYCRSLKGPIKLLGVRIIKERAFGYCHRLTDVEFGDKLETIERHAFHTTALKKIKMPSVRTIGKEAFAWCDDLSDVECGEALRTLQEEAFDNCRSLERISLPLKGNMIEDGAFYRCPTLTTVHLVGGIHRTIASLHLESWRNEMMDEINRINLTLYTFTAWHKTGAIQRWMETVINRLDRYKTEHKYILKEAATLLELALWKTKLDCNEKSEVAKGEQRHRERKELRVTSGADVVIKSVLPFLQIFK